MEAEYFAFQYASVDYIIQFKERPQKHKEGLNLDYQRIDYSVEHFHEIPLEKNYHSTQSIIDFPEQALRLEATKNEVIDKEKIRLMITHLKAVNNAGPTEIVAYTGLKQKRTICLKSSQDCYKVIKRA